MLKQENVGNMGEFEEYLGHDTEIDINNLNQIYSINSNDLATLDLEQLGSFNSQGNLVMYSPPDISEETLDIASVPSSLEEIVPTSPRGPPCRTPFTGDLNFCVEINAKDTNRKKYLYSHQLNRIYVDRKMNFPVQFRWDFERGMSPMFVRATTVFSDESQAEKRVERCLQHTHESTNAGIQAAIVANVLHSSREPGTQDVYYCGEPSLPDSWYSVVLRFEGRSQDAYSHAYQFVCKNSCSSGINRRAIDIIFTLEDHKGHIYGRQIVGARVCACPKRDKLKDEEAEPRPNSNSNKRRLQPPPATKKVKLEPDDDVFVLPPLPIVGRKTLITGLEVMQNMMEAVAAKCDQDAADKYHTAVRSLKDKIEELRNPQE